ncbi:MAG: WG repeat-containing protein [Oscillospiraceae bacterium]|nr:WG repeat-containing protein [Oscillospiraceae bacterium]
MIGFFTFNNGRAAVNVDIDLGSRRLTSLDRVPRRYGFINKDGELVIPLVFNMVDSSYSPFGGGVAAVALSNRWRYIDRMGNVVLVDNRMPDYDWAHNFSEGLAWVRQGNVWGILQLVPAG